MAESPIPTNDNRPDAAAGATIDLDRDQLRFLALLQVFAEPVPINVVGILAPLLPGPLMDLLETAEAAGWIRRPAKGQFTIGDNIPGTLQKELDRINRPEYLAGIVSKLYHQSLEKELGTEALINLLEKAGHCRFLAEKEIEIAHLAVQNNNLEKARKFLEKAVKRLCECQQDENLGSLFISSVLELSNLYFTLGYGFQHVYQYLLKARKTATDLGDRRSHALANLHMGRTFYFTGRRDDALVAFSQGYKEIQDLGDEDILGQSAAFLGKFYFTKGYLKKAIMHFEKAEQLLEKEGTTILTTPTAPVFLGYCAMYLGQFHRAIGSLDYYWRLAEEQGNQATASIIRAILGTVLVILKKYREARTHFDEVLKTKKGDDFSFGPYLAGGGIALMYFQQGKLEKAYETLRRTIEKGSHIGLVRQYSSPWVMEMIYEFQRLGFPSLPGFNFDDLLDQALNGSSIHLRGVAWRLKAQMDLHLGHDPEEIMEELKKSEEDLMIAGDRVQQAKSIFVMIKIELQKGDRKVARNLMYRARRLLGGYVDELFPAEFKGLMEQDGGRVDKELRRQSLLQDYLQMFESLYPSDDEHEVLAKMLNSTSCIFGAERSGLFWFQHSRDRAPKLQASYNLSRKETQAESFRGSMAMVFKARQSNQAQMGRLQSVAGVRVGKHPIRSALCVPIEVNHRVQAVLYYDNSYLNDAFGFLNPEIMKQLMQHTNLIVERHLNYLKLKNERDQLAIEKSFHMEKEVKIISRSRKMARIMRQVDQVAGSDSTILITGETGTGKELLASRIHQCSDRADGPFIVVDSTAIPDNLLESELFGHEKGAFTGADRKKVGRIELAHKGTLFMDEIGELPLAAQAKLLRALQTKKFNRVGGTKMITADFRLIAATNRNLAREVENGRFREDLYFRLNVIPIHLPPLRERSEDIPPLAEFYLNFYTRKYKRHGLVMSAEQMKSLQNYHWPGNIRELQNILERAVLLSDDDQLEIRLPAEIQVSGDSPFADLPSLEEIQRRYIGYVLKQCGGKIGGPGGAAETLGMKRTSLYSRMKKLGLKV